jgi:hypothetical protein
MPIPTFTMPIPLQHNPEFFLKPTFTRAKHHDAAGTACHCTAVTIHNTHHRQIILPDTCLKLQFTTPTACDINPTIVPQKRLSENPSRSFGYDAACNAHVLLTPSPFLISTRYSPKPFLPALAKEDNQKYLSLHFTLFKPAFFTKLAEAYLTQPDQWTAEQHPIYTEPSADDELSKISSTLYGIETIFRTSLIQHPCKTPAFPIYIACLTDTYLVPTITLSADKFAVDSFISTHLRPFYADGNGQVYIQNPNTYSIH